MAGRQRGVESGRELASGAPASSAPALSMNSVGTVTADDVDASSSSARVIHVGLSTEFVQGHVPGASWVPRGWLEFRIGDVAPDKDAPIIVTCADGGAQSLLAAATLTDMGYTDVSTLDGGTKAWQNSGCDVEVGLTGVMSPPNDTLPMAPDRGFADMVNYLRWEEELGHKYAVGD